MEEVSVDALGVTAVVWKSPSLDEVSFCSSGVQCPLQGHTINGVRHRQRRRENSRNRLQFGARGDWWLQWWEWSWVCAQRLCPPSEAGVLLVEWLPGFTWLHDRASGDVLRHRIFVASCAMSDGGEALSQPWPWPMVGISIRPCICMAFCLRFNRQFGGGNYQGLGACVVSPHHHPGFGATQ